MRQRANSRFLPSDLELSASTQLPHGYTPTLSVPSFKPTSIENDGHLTF